MTKPCWSYVFGLECLDFKESSYSQLPGSLSPDYKYLHAVSHQLSFPSQTISDCIRYIIGVFESQTNILASYLHTSLCQS